MDMYDTTQQTIPKYTHTFFTFLFSFYPQEYREHFEEEMRIVLNDLYQEEITTYGHIRMSFFITQSFDIIQNSMKQHLILARKSGMKHYFQHTFHINTYTLISAILLLPFVFMSGVDIIARIVQGDFGKPNHAVYSLLGHTFLYATPILFIWVLAFPLIALILTTISLIINETKVRMLSLQFIRNNLVSIILLIIAIGCIGIVRFHDFAPCVIKNVRSNGLGNIQQIVSVCNNA